MPKLSSLTPGYRLQGTGQAVVRLGKRDIYLGRYGTAASREVYKRLVAEWLTNGGRLPEPSATITKLSSCVRLLKQPNGHEFRSYPEGDLLAHVRKDQSRFLGAVLAVVRGWHARGKPRSKETRHDFRGWVQVLDWIVQHLLGGVPLMDGHRETQQRTTNRAMNWLRDLALAVVCQGCADKWLIAKDLLEIIDADGSVEIPGLKDGDVADDAVQQLGASTDRRGATARRLAALPCVRIVQDGDDGVNVVFHVDDFDNIAAISTTPISVQNTNAAPGRR